MSKERQEAAPADPGNAQISRLNSQEYEVLKMTLQGWTAEEIAASLGLHAPVVAELMQSDRFQEEFQAEVERQGLTVDASIDTVAARAEAVIMDVLTFGTIRVSKRDKDGKPNGEFSEKEVPVALIVKEASAIFSGKNLRRPMMPPTPVTPSITTPALPAGPTEPRKNFRLLKPLGQLVIEQYVQKKANENAAAAGPGSVTLIPNGKSEGSDAPDSDH